MIILGKGGIMKYLIPIDRSSIKPNEHYPHLGRYEIYPRELTRVDIYRGYGLEANGNTKWVLVSQETMEPKPEYEYMEALGKAPKYFYSYSDTMVQCNSCLKKFDYAELELDWIDYLDARTDTKCPFCEAWDCCEIEYEKLSEEILKGIYESNKQSSN